MHYLYRYVCILNGFFIYVYGQLSAIKNILNVQDLYHVKLLKFYYKLVHDELPSYFNTYSLIFRHENMDDHGYALQLDVGK